MTATGFDFSASEIGARRATRAQIEAEVAELEHWSRVARLSALERIHDGFQLAEVDLKLRGPGDFFGTRQSGLPALRMAHLSDRRLLEMARDEAARLMEQDPELKAPEHAALAAQVARFVDQASADVG